ncbi:MAG TPA: response regulator [Chitinophagaceae bacterium]
MSMIKRLLLVDDDADDRFLFKKALDELRTAVNLFLATDGEDALETLETIYPLPDLIFLDLNLPRLNGIQCLEKIKQHRLFSQVPVIMYSTTFTEGDKTKATQLGASHFLMKPFSITALCRELAYVFSIDWKKKRV